MRSTPPDDITTRARIRDAAIGLFGRHGFAETSVRAIAAQAEVSAALIIHHFGSKDGLRSACNNFVVDAFFRGQNELTDDGAWNAMQARLADIDQFRPLVDYLSRMLTEDSPASDELFDTLLSSTARMLDEQVEAGVVRPSLDRDVTAVYITLYGIVPLILGRQVARALGGDQLDGAILRRSTLPILDLYTNGLYTDARIFDAASDALERTAGPSSGNGESDSNRGPAPPA